MRDADGERWHQWQARNAVAARITHHRARVAFALLFVGLGIWLALALRAAGGLP